MILLDTNVVAEPLRPLPDAKVVAWLDRNFPECAIASVSAFELLAGVELLATGRRRDLLRGAVDEAISRFGARVLAFDGPAAASSARLLGVARKSGLSLHQVPAKLADLQIAGIAESRGMSLATRNGGDFAGLGLRIIDPWQS